MAECGYLMESEAVAIRLDVKTAGRDAEKQALWAGLKPKRKLRADCRGLRRLSLEGQAPVGVAYLPVNASNVSEQPAQIFKVGLDLGIHVDDPQVVGLFEGYGVSLGI